MTFRMTFRMSGLLLPSTILLMFGCIVMPVRGQCTLNQLHTCIPAFSDVCNIGISAFSCASTAEACLRNMRTSCDTNTYSYGYVGHLADVVNFMCTTKGAEDFGNAASCFATHQSQFTTVFTNCRASITNCKPNMAYTNCLGTGLKAQCQGTTYDQARSYIDVVADGINTYVLFTEKGSKAIGSSGNTLRTTVSVFDLLVLTLGMLRLASVYN